MTEALRSCDQEIPTSDISTTCHPDESTEYNEGNRGNDIQNVNSTQRKIIHADDADTTEALRSCDQEIPTTSDISTTCHPDESREYSGEAETSERCGDLSTSPSTSGQMSRHMEDDPQNEKDGDSSVDVKCEQSSISLVSNYSSSDSDSDKD